MHYVRHFQTLILVKINILKNRWNLGYTRRFKLYCTTLVLVLCQHVHIRCIQFQKFLRFLFIKSILPQRDLKWKFQGKGKHIWTMESHSFRRMKYIKLHNSLNKLLVPFCLSWRVLQPPDLGMCEVELTFLLLFLSNCSSCVNLSRTATTFVMLLLLLLPLHRTRIGKYNYHSFNV